MSSYCERSRKRADDLIAQFGETSVAEAGRRLTEAAKQADIENTFLWLDVWAVLDKHKPGNSAVIITAF